jgi:predicted NAD/FAD-binding protein
MSVHETGDLPRLGTVSTRDAARQSVAVVGSGIAGLTAAYLLARSHSVVLFEAEQRLGGHAHTHDVVDSDGHPHPVDSGFIVHNDMTYPLLSRLFRELGVEVRTTEMSMSVRCEGCGLEYAGGRGLRGILAQPQRVADRRFVRMLREVKQFHRSASAFLRTTGDDDLTTYGQFLQRERFSGFFVAHYAIPVVSCVWSAGQESALTYPARYLFQFLDHHRMLRVTGSPQWYHVVGGSRTYVERIRTHLGEVRTGRAVTDITRRRDAVEIRDIDGQVTHVDRVVIATHADQALSLLTDPTDDEVTVLKAFGYSTNHTLLHTDGSLLPRTRGARSSWNYRLRSCDRLDQPAIVTYWMNRLQGLDSHDSLLVTLNDNERVARGRVIATMEYQHPIYTPEAVQAQSRLRELATDRTVYAGAYHGWGFHEDGCRSGAAAARHFGVTW